MTRIQSARALALGLATGLTLLLSACGGREGPEMATVTGKVTYKGQPVTTGTVNFTPNDPNGAPANANIAPDGTYSLQTIEPDDGARVGEYKVSISGKDPNGMNNALPGAPVDVKSILPEKYENPATSGLTAKVEGGSNTHNFELE